MSKYLESCQIKHFIPMVKRNASGKDGKIIQKLQPAVHNLIFLQADKPIGELKKVVSECPYSISVYCHADKPGEWYRISESDITDLRIICDISYSEPLFISQEEAELKVGTTVRVIHGPMRGLIGKLVRKNKKYYIVKNFVGMAVMVAVSRWCCEAVEKEL